MPWSTASANAQLQLLLWNVNFANVGDATGLRGSSVNGPLYAFLSTADPGAGGNATTNECAYGGYARQALQRDNTVWNIAGNIANLIAELAFPLATSGSETALYWGLTPASSGSSIVLIRGPVSPSLAISSGKTPIITPASTFTLPTV